MEMFLSLSLVLSSLSILSSCLFLFSTWLFLSSLLSLSMSSLSHARCSSPELDKRNPSRSPPSLSPALSSVPQIGGPKASPSTLLLPLYFSRFLSLRSFSCILAPSPWEWRRRIYRQTDGGNAEIKSRATRSYSYGGFS